MQCSRSQIEGAGVEEEEGAPACGDGGELGEADVVAYCNGDAAVGGQVNEGDFVSWGEHLRLFERDFPRDIDIEQMNLAVGRHQLASWPEKERGVVVFVGGGDVFGDAAPQKVGFRFGCERGQGVEGGGLGLCGWGGKELLGIGGEVLAPVGRIEAFWEDNEGGAGAGGLEDS